MTNFWRFAKHLLHEKAALFWAMFFAFFSAGGLAAGLLSMAPLLKIILNPASGQSLADIAKEHNATGAWLQIPSGVISVLPSDPFRGVLLIICGLAALTILGGFANFLHQYLSQTVVTRAVARIRQEAFEHVIHLPLARVMTRGPSEFVARLIRDTSDLHQGLTALVSKAISGTLKGLAGLVVACIIDWQITLIAIPTIIVMAVVLRKLGKRIRRGTRGALRASESLLRVSTEALQGLRAVKANTAEDDAVRRFTEMNDEAVRQELRVRTAKALSSPLIEALTTIVALAFALLGAASVISGTKSLDELTLVLGSLVMAGASVRPLTGLVAVIQSAAAPADRLADLMAEPSETSPPAGHEAMPQAPRHSRSLEFDAVSFTYANATQPALQKVSLNILHGERIAIVGPNGCGKTTLLSLLPRLLTPDVGRVLIDGVDVATVDLRSLRRQIGVVTQDAVLFRGSIADNIAFGLMDVTRTQVIEAARRAHADEFIQSIPGSSGSGGGYDANVLEQGASLSGGQRQRLAIARAILRDPTILILDEATSQIDAESEALINNALTEFCTGNGGRTALVIAHRLSTVLNADRIVVMDSGQIIDQGTHEQLLDRCDLYRRLSRTQLVNA